MTDAWKRARAAADEAGARYWDELTRVVPAVELEEYRSQQREMHREYRKSVDRLNAEFDAKHGLLELRSIWATASNDLDETQ